MTDADPASPLRKGWTTGACATAAVKAAYAAVLTGTFPDPVEIALPGGQHVAFALARQERLGPSSACAGIVKDAGDDPDVTHGALVIAIVRRGAPGAGVTFKAGDGVGTITRAGLALAPGEPAINPVPRAMIRTVVAELARAYDADGDVEVEIAIPGGARLAERTLNGRLGIVGGLSILGTTGIVVPYSCAAWIHTIHRGIDVARAEGVTHVAGATGTTSEAGVRTLYGLPDVALIDMGDFVGGMLKYLRAHPVSDVTIAGGFAKMTKLGQGLLDLHSKRGEVDLRWLARQAADAGAPPGLATAVAAARTANEVRELSRDAGLDLAAPVADAAWRTAVAMLSGTAMRLEIAVFDREGAILARTGLRPSA